MVGEDRRGGSIISADPSRPSSRRHPKVTGSQINETVAKPFVTVHQGSVAAADLQRVWKGSNGRSAAAVS